MDEQENIFKTNNSNIDWLSYNATKSEAEISKENEEKLLQFKERIKCFENIVTLEEAQEMSRKILPVAQEYSQFRVGNAQCIIVNKADMLRISLDSNDEFICYDFV